MPGTMLSGLHPLANRIILTTLSPTPSPTQGHVASSPTYSRQNRRHLPWLLYPSDSTPNIYSASKHTQNPVPLILSLPTPTPGVAPARLAWIIATGLLLLPLTYRDRRNIAKTETRSRHSPALNPPVPPTVT